MSTQATTISSKFLSLKISLYNAAGDLGRQADAARDAGDDKLSADLAAKSIEMAMQGIELRKREYAARKASVTDDNVKTLEEITGQAKKISDYIKAGTDVLENAAKFLALIASIVAIFA